MFWLFFRLVSLIGINPFPLFEGHWKGSYLIDNQSSTYFEINSAQNQNNGNVLKGTILKIDKINLISPQETFITTFSIIYSSKQQKFIILLYNYDGIQLPNEIVIPLKMDFGSIFPSTIRKYGYIGFLPKLFQISNLSFFFTPNEINLRYIYNSHHYFVSAQCFSHHSILSFLFISLFLLLFSFIFFRLKNIFKIPKLF